MRLLFSLPAYLLFLSAVLKVFVFPVTEPTRYGPRPLVGMTALEAVTLAALGVTWLRGVEPALQDVASHLWISVRAQRWRWIAVLGAVVILTALLGSMLSHRKPGHVATIAADQSHPAANLPTVPDPPPGFKLQLPPEPMLGELARSSEIESAAIVIDVWVNIGHKTWDELSPSNQDKLCGAGKSIRASMNAWHNAPADLNHTMGAIYEITQPAGRCR